MPGVRLLLLMFNLSDMRSKIFLAGFLGGLLLFAAANIHSYYRMLAEPVLIDATVSFGIPFRFYVTGGFVGGILWWRLIADVLIALMVSVILGWVSAKLFGHVAAA